MVDSFTGWVELVPIPDKCSFTVARAMFYEWVCRYGIFRYLLTDQGGEFWGSAMKGLMSLMGTSHLRTSGWRPQTNGRCERVNRVIN